MTYIQSFDPIILFFVLGLLASWMGSNLKIPTEVSTFLSIFLLLSIGLKGGHEVRLSDDLHSFIPSLSIGIASCLALPFAIFFIMRKQLGLANAAALSCAYGSVSAVTFITAQSILDIEQISHSGYMVAVMALMEIPAIVIGIYLYVRYQQESFANMKSIFTSVMVTKSVVLLVGGFAIGLALNEKAWTSLSPVFQGGFKGVLAFFLIDLGILAQTQLRQATAHKLMTALVAFVLPLVAGTSVLLAAHAAGIKQGDQVLLAVLAGSASYIAAPAAVRFAIPLANPGLYMTFPLALTFPFNLLLGIPFYLYLARAL